MDAKVKEMRKIKYFPLIVIMMSICMLGGRPIHRSACESNLPENIKCAAALTANDSQMAEIAKKHPELIIKAATVKTTRF